MPLWNAADNEALTPSRPVEVMTGTVMTDGQETQAIALPTSPTNRAIDLAFVAKFASDPPGTVDYQLQVAFNNVDAEFFDLGSSMTNSETVGGMIIVTNVVARFARVIANDADSVAVTIEIMSM